MSFVPALLVVGHEADLNGLAEGGCASPSVRPLLRALEAPEPTPAAWSSGVPELEANLRERSGVVRQVLLLEDLCGRAFWGCESCGERDDVACKCDQEARQRRDAAPLGEALAGLQRQGWSAALRREREGWSLEVEGDAGREVVPGGAWARVDSTPDGRVRCTTKTFAEDARQVERFTVRQVLARCALDSAIALRSSLQALITKHCHNLHGRVDAATIVAWDPKPVPSPDMRLARACRQRLSSSGLQVRQTWWIGEAPGGRPRTDAMLGFLLGKLQHDDGSTHVTCRDRIWAARGWGAGDLSRGVRQTVLSDALFAPGAFLDRLCDAEDMRRAGTAPRAARRAASARTTRARGSSSPTVADGARQGAVAVTGSAGNGSGDTVAGGEAREASTIDDVLRDSSAASLAGEAEHAASSGRRARQALREEDPARNPQDAWEFLWPGPLTASMMPLSVETTAHDAVPSAQHPSHGGWLPAAYSDRKALGRRVESTRQHAFEWMHAARHAIPPELRLAIGLGVCALMLSFVLYWVAAASPGGASGWSSWAVASLAVLAGALLGVIVPAFMEATRQDLALDSLRARARDLGRQWMTIQERQARGLRIAVEHAVGARHDEQAQQDRLRARAIQLALRDELDLWKSRMQAKGSSRSQDLPDCFGHLNGISSPAELGARIRDRLHAEETRLLADAQRTWRDEVVSLAHELLGRGASPGGISRKDYRKALRGVLEAHEAAFELALSKALIEGLRTDAGGSDRLKGLFQNVFAPARLLGSRASLPVPEQVGMDWSLSVLVMAEPPHGPGRLRGVANVLRSALENTGYRGVQVIDSDWLSSECVLVLVADTAYDIDASGPGEGAA